MDALALMTCYPAFLITAEVPIIYMHQFWATVSKHTSSYRFKIDKKRFSVNVEVFIEIRNICPKVLGKAFDEPPIEEEALSFIRKLGYTREIKYITDVIVDHIHQPWRTFASIINKCLCGKEELAYQIDNIDSKKQDNMFYPRFIKIIIHHFITKDKSISMRNRIFMHTAKDDSLLGTIRFISRHADTQLYGAILPQSMTNQALLDFIAYKTYYAIASGAEPPKSRKSQKKSESAILSEESPTKKKLAKAKKDAATKPKPTKKKAPVKQECHASHASGSDDGIDLGSRVPDEQHRKTSGIDEGTGIKPGVPDVPKYDSESEQESWGDSDEEDDDDKDDSGDESDAGDNNDEQAEKEEEYDDERVHTPSDYELTEEEKIDDEEKMDDEEEDEVTKELYKDVNMNLRYDDAEMTNADQGGADQQNVFQESGYEQVEEDAHVTLTVVHDTQKTDGTTQSSFVSSDFTSKLLNLDNPSPTNNMIPSLMDTTIHHEELTSQTSSLFTILVTVVPEITSATTKAIQSHNVECREEALADKKEYIDLVDTSVRTIIREEVKTQLFKILPQAVSEFATPVIEKTIEENKTYQIANYKKELYDALVQSYNTNKDLFDTYGEVFSLKRSQDERDKDQDPSARSDRGTKRRNSNKEAESSTLNIKFDTGHTEEQPDDEAATKVDWFKKPKRPPTPDRDWNKRKQINFRPPQTWISKVAHPEEPPTSFDQLNDTPFDFYAFVMNQLNISNLTQEILWGLKHQLFYGFATNKTSSKDVYSRKRIITITRVKIMKWYDYGHLNEIEVCRDDQELYTFKEGDFPRLHLQYIKVMLLLLVQQNLTNLTLDERYDLNVALRMFTRRIVIQRLVEDLQLGVKSYQKKLNLTKPDTFRSGLKKRTAYTAYLDPQGDIDRQLFQRRLMRNLEKFIGGREYEEDLRLLEQTV
ncbi:hypothetical protein Tco_0625598 [Tanacetum coccineum]|uniref:Uncharacterized protein n=1 Tax=Tanacetum coccineum TaxID=301880 RepID=A0ABQ4WH99_9ASTR